MCVHNMAASLAGGAGRRLGRLTRNCTTLRCSHLCGFRLAVPSGTRSFVVSLSIKPESDVHVSSVDLWNVSADADKPAGGWDLKEQNAVFFKKIGFTILTFIFYVLRTRLCPCRFSSGAIYSTVTKTVGLFSVYDYQKIVTALFKQN